MKHLKFIAALLIAAFMTSCMSTRTVVGDYKALQGEEYTYAKGKQLYLFWGLIPLGRTNVNTPNSKNCEVRTYYNFLDALLSTITGGIFEMQTIKVKAKREPVGNNANTPAIQINNVQNANN